MWINPLENPDLVIFTEEIFNGKLHFLRSGQKVKKETPPKAIALRWGLKIKIKLVCLNGKHIYC